MACLLLAGAGCKRYTDIPAEPATKTPHPAFVQGQFLDAALSPLDDAFVAAQAAKAAYVLVGESHPLACDHLAQARVLELMVRAGAQPAVGLEMVSTDYQPVLELFNKGLIGVDDLRENLHWDRTWGYPFEVYRPVFEAAREFSLPLFALNVPRETARKVGRTGLASLSREERLELPAKILPPPKAQEDFLRQIFEAHPTGQSRKDREAAWKSFVTVQSLWDTAMARRAVEVRVATRRPVVILAGTGHVEYGWGIASRLAVFDPGGQRLLFAPWRGGPAPGPAPASPPDPASASGPGPAPGSAPDRAPVAASDSAMADIFFACPEVKRPRLGLTLDTREGTVRVVAVEPGSRAEAAGLAAGDVIAAAGGKPVRALGDLHEATTRAMAEGRPVRLDILRGDRTVGLDIPLPAPKAQD